MNETRTLLGRDDPSPFVVTNPGAESPFLLVGDHAGREIPAALGDLGVPASEMDRHIAWDIGISGLGRKLAEQLGACFIEQRYSRLVIDCNRDPVRDDAIPKVSDGTTIPANANLSPEEREARRREIFQPYHDRIAAELDARSGRPTVLIALHSFTPTMQGSVRPWRHGVLHMGQSAASRRLLALLREEVGAAGVGDNEPYAMDNIDYTVPHHAIARGLDYVEIENRQDLLADDEGERQVAAQLSRLLSQLAAD